MKQIICLLSSCLMLSVLQGQIKKNEIRVRFKDATAVTKPALNGKENLLDHTPVLKKLQSKYGLSHLRGSFYFSKTERLRRTYRLKFSKEAELQNLLKELNALAEVEWAEPLPDDRVHWTPNDIGANTSNGQYGLHIINAEAAWNINRGSTSVVVAVVDCGVQLQHPDLQNKLVSGYDVSEGDSNPDIPNTSFKHGTHVAGIVGAQTNNNIGMASIGNRVRVMPIKATEDDSDPLKIDDGYEGITWAAEHGADVINCSWGSYSASSFNQDIITLAYDSYGAVIVASAGNDNTSASEYPAAYSNVLAVASTTIEDEKSSFSNFGIWVDIAAPGTHIYSTIPDLPNDGYTYFQGTSMAAPFVAGVCGLIKSTAGSYSAYQVMSIVKSTANPIIYANQPGYNGLLGTGRLDAYAALVSASLCWQSETISGNPYTRPLTESSNWIRTSSTCIIQPNDQVILDAALEIELKAGFHAQAGTVFRAAIEGCGDGPPDGSNDRTTTSSYFFQLPAKENNMVQPVIKQKKRAIKEK